jgi:hypothetical protein
LDKVKALDIGETYMNEKAATNFIKYIGISEREQTISLLEKSLFFSFLMDGTTDISGDEQESIYIRFSNKNLKFLHPVMKVFMFFLNSLFTYVLL